MKPTVPNRQTNRDKSPRTPTRRVLDYIENRRDIFRLNSASNELSLMRSHTDHLGMQHLYFQQHHRDIPIWGRELVAHVAGAGTLDSINCLVEPTAADLTTTPVVSSQQALELAQRKLAEDGVTTTLAMEDYANWGFAPIQPLLCYWQSAPGQPLYLAWMVELHPNMVDWVRYFVDAGNGEIRVSYNLTADNGPATATATNLAGNLVNIHTYQIDSMYYMLDGSTSMFVAGQTSNQLRNNPQGVIYTVNARNQDITSTTPLQHFTSANNTWTDRAAVSTQDYVRQTYDFYYNFGRNSFDGHGSTVMALLHVTESGQAMDNAYWNGSFVVLGDGQTLFKSLAGGRDVIAHEFTHAVVQYTANLEYTFQSGALNETFADIGGVSVDTPDFTLGEDVVKGRTYFPSGVLRDMANPHNGGSGPSSVCWQPANMSEYQVLSISQDNGGVHLNSGITNLAAYKIFQAVGRPKAQQILYRALINYLTSQSNFTDFRLAAVQSAIDLYGDQASEPNSVKTAFDEVGIVEGTGTTPPPDSPPVTGMQYLLGVNEFDGYYTDNSLLLSNAFTNIGGLSQLYYLSHLQVNTGSGHPLAADRYGQFIYFIDDKYNLHRAVPNVSHPAEEQLTLSGSWWSLAISPNGEHLAMTKRQSDKSIWIFDLTQSPVTSIQLPLRHPTTDHQNVYTDIVDYADSMVFLDETMLAYDCHNTIQSPGQGTISFWDVNIIDITNGKILPILPPQPTGVNVGNPTTASTNSSILCVERIDGQQNQVLGINLITGEVGEILTNSTDLATPHYSPDDHQLVFARGNDFGGHDVYCIELAEDKIHAATNAQPARLLDNVQLPIWFVVGTPPSVSVNFAAPASCAPASEGTAAIPVILSGISAEVVTVGFAVTGGTAIGGGVDYTLEPGQITFPAGTTSQTITFPVNDHASNSNKTIILTLSHPINAWLGETSTHTYDIVYPMTLTPSLCLITAGNTPGHDRLLVRSNFPLHADDLAQAQNWIVRISSAPGTIYEETIPISLFIRSGGNYIYRRPGQRTDGDQIALLMADANLSSLMIMAQDINLTGLSAPVQLDIEVGNQFGRAQMTETIINGASLIPMRLLRSYADDLRVDAVNATPTTLSIRGAIAVKDTSVDLTQQALTLHWGDRNVIIPAGEFRKSGSRYVYQDPLRNHGSVLMALFDFDRSTFQVLLYDTHTASHTGTVNFGLTFATYDQTRAYTF